MLQGQFVDPRQQQLEEEAEVVGDPPVPVVIKGELPNIVRFREISLTPLLPAQHIQMFTV